MKSVVLFVCISFLYPFLGLWAAAIPPAQMQSQTERRPGRLSGHVVTDTGQPLANIRITIMRVGDQRLTSMRTTATDERGAFQFSALAGGSYTASVRAPGYIRADGSNESQYCRPGDYVTLTMVKGGVITGIVRVPSGEPVIGAPVRAFRTKDLDGKPATVTASFAHKLTDDRGVYRLYGLAPGYYLVCAGGGARSYMGFNKYQRDAPTYYPSSARQTAEKVMLQLGREVSDINIVYRGEGGHSVSGVTTGIETNQFSQPVTVALLERSTGEIRDFGNTNQDRAFAFYGVPDGEYYLVAQYSSGNEKERAISRPNRVSVAEKDVSDVKLTLSQLGSVSGRVVLEPLSKDASEKCATRASIANQEVILSLQREKTKDEPEILWDTLDVYGAPNKNGFFDIYGINAGKYRINAVLPSEFWFTKSAVIAKSRTGNFRIGTNPGAVDSFLGSIQVQLGTQVQLTITLAEGAARLNGRVLLNNARTSPSRMSVHLVPMDPKDSENALRFFQVDAQDDGVFSFKSIAPGKYRILVLAGADDGGTDSSSPPSPWTAGGRAILRKEAQKSKAVVDLHPCQTTQDYKVRYEPGG